MDYGRRWFDSKTTAPRARQPSQFPKNGQNRKFSASLGREKRPGRGFCQETTGAEVTNGKLSAKQVPDVLGHIAASLVLPYDDVDRSGQPSRNQIASVESLFVLRKVQLREPPQVFDGISGDNVLSTLPRNSTGLRWA